MTAVLVTMGLAIILLAVLVVGLLRSHAEILRALHQLGAGDELPHSHDAPHLPRPRLNTDAPSDVTGTTLRGSTRHIGVSGTGTKTLLAFLSTGCTACLALWNDLAVDPTGGIGGARLVVVTKGPEAESQSRLEELASQQVNLVQSTQAWDDYGVPVTPYFVLVQGGDVVGEGSAASWGQVLSLMRQAGADLAARTPALDPPDHPELKADTELRKAGIGPGHPSLYPDRTPVDGE